MEKIRIDKNDLKIHNFVITYTSPIDYEMQRYILLEDIKGLEYDTYVIAEGGHCSCYDFDEIVLRPEDAEKVQEAADILRGLQEYGEGTIPLYIKPNNMPS